MTKTKEELGVSETADALEAQRESGAEGARNEGARDGRRAGRPKGGVSRRSLLIGAGSCAVLLGLGGLRYAGHNPLVRPAGGQDESHLVSACIRCERCYEACPRGVIVPARIEDGLLGMRTPALDFSANYCDFCAEENGGVPKCVEVCPTEALALDEGAVCGNPDTGERGNVILGLASIDEYSCLAFRDTGCKACYDACKFSAIRLEGSERNPRPYVIADACNGCGACEAACRSLSAGSIVEGATQRAIVVKLLDSAQ